VVASSTRTPDVFSNGYLALLFLAAPLGRFEPRRPRHFFIPDAPSTARPGWPRPPLPQSVQRTRSSATLITIARISLASGSRSHARAQAPRANLHTDRERAPDLPMRPEPVGDEEGVCPASFHAEPPCRQRASGGCDRRQQKSRSDRTCLNRTCAIASKSQPGAVGQGAATATAILPAVVGPLLAGRFAHR
jgi:hypothetical protein